MASKPRQPLTSAQLEIMDIVWERGEVGVAEIWQALCRKRPLARNTVQTTLARLQQKGWLRHRQQGNAFYYTTAQPRRRVLGGLLSRLIDTAFGGSTTGLVLTLLEESKLSPAEADRIRELIDRAEARRHKRGEKEAR
jgi:predicted transcriptional regulator